MRFGESVVAGMTPPERTQWEANPLSGAVPAVAVDGATLYANYLGYVFALNLESGKLLWRSASFHNVEVPAAQDQARMIDPTRFAILASKSHVWSLGRDLKDPNQHGAVPPDLPAGRRRRRRLADRRTCPTTPRSTWSARRSWPARRSSSWARPPMNQQQQDASRISTSWRSGPTTASCSGRRRSGCSGRASGSSTTA